MVEEHQFVSCLKGGAFPGRVR